MVRAPRAAVFAAALGLLTIGERLCAQTRTSSPPAPGALVHEHRHEEGAGEQGHAAPPLTDADRAAAFPHLHEAPHAVHDYPINAFVLFDQFEWRHGATADAVSWDAKGWVGQDINRLWFRSEGGASPGSVEEAQAHLLYGRAIARWWDFVAGIRQDWRPGPAQTWAAVGLQGLAPYFFEIEATAYVGANGRTHFRFETEYDLLITNRLILQPSVEVEIVGARDDERRVAPGLSSGDAGLRVRYEFRREFAPYVGVVWSRKFFGTAELAFRNGHEVRSTAVIVGGRVWF